MGSRNRQERLNTGNGDYIRNLNRGIVLDLIRTHEPISRAAIAKATGLSRSTCSLVVDDLIRAGLVTETGKDRSSGGRKPILLELNSETGMAIGVKLMADAVIAAVVDLRGAVLHRAKRAVTQGIDLDGYLAVLAETIAAVIDAEHERSQTSSIFGIGVGLGGLVDESHGTSLRSSILNWRDVPLREIIERRFQLPVYVENDVNALTLGEYWFGEARGVADVLCVTLGRGVGLGIITNGRLVRGAHHGAGEFGHAHVSDDPGAPVDSAGIRGTVEAFASDGAIVAFVADAIQRGEHTLLNRTRLDRDLESAIEAVRKAAAAGDRPSRDAFRRAGRYLGYGLASLINILDPEVVLISGEGSASFPFMVDEVERAIAETAVYGLDKRNRRIQITMETDLWVRGVATLVIREVFALGGGVEVISGR